MDLSLQNEWNPLYFALKMLFFFCEKLEISAHTDAKQGIF